MHCTTSSLLLALCYLHCAISTLLLALSGNLHSFAANCNMSQITRFVCYFLGWNLRPCYFLRFFHPWSFGWGRVGPEQWTHLNMSPFSSNDDMLSTIKLCCRWKWFSQAMEVFPRSYFLNGKTTCWIALWVKPCWKVDIEEFSNMFPSGPIFMYPIYFRQNIWRFSSVQFHFCYIFGTSWTQPNAEERLTIELVSIQAGCE